MKKQSEKIAPHVEWLKQHKKTTKKIRSNLSRVRKTTDKEIERDAANDQDVAPIFDKWPEDAKIYIPEKKILISLRVDAEVLDFFRKQGPGHLSKMNSVLKAYMKSHKDRAA